MTLCIDVVSSKGLLEILAPFVAILVTVILYFLNRKSERKHERFKQYIDKRIVVVEEAINFLMETSEIFASGTVSDEQNSWISTNLKKVRIDIQLFGTEDEFEQMENICRGFEHHDLVLINGMPNLMLLLADNLRNEFGLPKRFNK